MGPKALYQAPGYISRLYVTCGYPHFQHLKNYQITNNKSQSNLLSRHFSRSLIKSLSPMKSLILKLVTESQAEAMAAVQ